MKKQSQRSAGYKAGKHHWNNPDVKVRIANQVYIDLVNCLVESLFGWGSQKLVCLEDLPHFIGLYERLAIWARSRCEIQLYFSAQQVSCLLKKLELPLFVERARDLAFQKWLAAEADCKDMNRKCWEIFQQPLTHKHTELQRAIELVKREIYPLLGEVPPDWDEVACFMKFGPGASLTHPHRAGGVLDKLQNHSALNGMELEVDWLVSYTGLFAEVLLPSTDFHASFEELSSNEPRVEYFDYAKIDFVPKSISEMRTIEIGPSLATLFQQAYDGDIRRRLKTGWGLDLARQSPNQQLAFNGSIAGDKPNSPCTIDLSSASDRISYGLVALLLPPAWVRTLSTYRAKKILHDGNFIKLEKFASMGNALTFSLQTLIFSAVVRSVLRERGWEGSRWRVYGDDIIVPRRAYDEVVARLELFGFKVNSQKSFSDGYFRESCGADFLRGTNVRPLYIKKPLTSVAELFKVLNLIQLTAARAPIPASCYRPLYRLVFSLVPRKFRLYGDTRHALDSCVWSPSVDGDAILHRRTGSKECPSKLAYFASLFTGYGGGLEQNCPLRNVAVPIEPHSLPGYKTGESYLLRRPFSKGLVDRPIRREELPFEPLLV